MLRVIKLVDTDKGVVYYIVNSMVADDLVTQGARASASMVST